MVEILKIATRISEKLGGVIVERDPAGAEVPGGCPADTRCEFSGEVRPSKTLLSRGIRFQEAESRRTRATQINRHFQERVYQLLRGSLHNLREGCGGTPLPLVNRVACNHGQEAAL